MHCTANLTAMFTVSFPLRFFCKAAEGDWSNLRSVQAVGGLSDPSEEGWLYCQGVIAGFSLPLSTRLIQKNTFSFLLLLPLYL